MSTRYKIRSPIDIWTAYGGDQQRIAQAMQLGVIRPEEGVLAVMEGKRKPPPPVAQGTVAQQVMGIVPPPTNPMAPGMGAPAPQPAPAMQAPMGAPMGAPPMQAPMPGMAMGGVVSLPIPGAMFDEPDNGGYGDGYSGGGLVAFSDGGAASDPLSWLYSPISSVYGVNRPTGAHSGHDFAVRGNTPIGLPAPGRVVKVGKDDVNGNFVVVRHPDGTSSSYSHLANPSVKEGQDVGIGQVIGLSGNTGRVRGKGGGYHLHFGAKDAEGNRMDPTALLKNLAAGVKSGTFANPASSSAAAANPSNLSALAGTSLANQFDTEYAAGEKFYDTKMPKPKREARNKLLSYLGEQGSAEALGKQAKEDKWSALAEFGFRMASTNSPYFLQAVGQAASATLPGTKEAKKAREERKMRAMQAYADAEGIDNEEAKDRVKFAMDFATTKLGYKDKDLTRATGIASTIFQERAATERTGMQVEGAKAQTRMTTAASANADAARAAALNKQMQGQAFEAASADVQAKMLVNPNMSQDAQNKLFTDRYSHYLTVLGAQPSQGGIPGLPSPDYKIDQ